MTSLKICSYNVRGLNQANKRRKVFSYLHNLKHDICLIQETHSVLRNEKYWSNEWGGKVLFSHGSSSSRGVAILFNPSFTVSTCKLYQDELGRFIIVDLFTSHDIITLVNVYAPNLDTPSFFDKISRCLENFNCDYLI